MPKKPKKKTAEKAVKKITKKTPKPKFAFQSIKGMHDILPQDQPFWDKARSETKSIADYYGFLRIDTPIVERAELFERGIGVSTDIVEKQMFFIKNSKDRLVLRPENTASIIRAYLEHGLSHLGQPAKLYYEGPMFRYEQPQEGRFRQFHQVGFEIVGGENDPVYDAQTMLVTYRLLEALKIGKLEIQINTIGCKTCRPLFRRRLVDYYKSKEICKDCKRRLAVNPLRLLDCKEEKCADFKKGAPTFLDSLCNACNCHFKTVLEYIEELDLPYSLNNHLVRGLDYYNRTVFEIFAEGVDYALASGGRYDYLAEMLGARVIPAVGASVGINRVIILQKAKGVQIPLKQRSKVFLIHIGNLAKKKSLSLIEELKKSGIRVEEALGKESLKTQLRQADKKDIEYALIFGQKEAFEDTIIIRDLQTGAQETVPLDKFIGVLKKKLK